MLFYFNKKLLFIFFIILVTSCWCYNYWITACFMWLAYVPFLIGIVKLKSTYSQFIVIPFAIIFIAYALSFNWFLLIPKLKLPIVFDVVVEAFIASLPFAIYLMLQKKYNNPRFVWILPFLIPITEYIWLHTKLTPAILLGNTQAPLICISQYVDLIGVTGATFLIVLLNVVVFRNLQLQNKISSIILKVALILLFPFVYSAYRIWQFHERPSTPDSLSVNLFRLDMPSGDDDFLENNRKDIKRLEKNIYLTDSISYTEKQNNDLSDVYIWHEGAFNRRIKKIDDYVRNIIKEDGVSVLTGIDSINGSQFINGSMVVYPDGSVSEKYIKMNFVNVWEDDYVRGKKYVLHPLKNKRQIIFKTATPICIEQFTPEHWANFRRQGAELFSQICFETWFNQGVGYEPLLSNMTALRCMENKLYGTRTSNGGAAAFINPLGVKYDYTIESDHLKNTVYKSEYSITFYSKYTWFPIILCFVGLIVTVILIKHSKMY